MSADDTMAVGVQSPKALEGQKEGRSPRLAKASRRDERRTREKERDKNTPGPFLVPRRRLYGDLVIRLHQK